MLSKRLYLGLLSTILFLNSFAQDFRKGDTHTLHQLIEKYKALDSSYLQAKLIEVGKSDNGLPIHLFVVSTMHFSDLEELSSRDEVRILINNGIHPGEACGIEASLLFAKNILEKNLLKSKKVVIGIIPAYNIGGMLNRGSYSRANQNGPKEYGFRGNAKNLDLNRDFIKMDSKNSFGFVSAFQSFDPDIFIDTHTTNGSDHQYTLTVISSQKDKLNPIISKFTSTVFLPSLYESMKKKNHEISPYVYPLKKEPSQGLHAFLETPRYSSGYTNLFNCISFITEAHVFKPFKDRVIQTQSFLESILDLAHNYSNQIKQARSLAFQFDKNRQQMPIKWELDSTKSETLKFKGYKTFYSKSNVTDLEILRYDRNQPLTIPIKYYNSYKVTDSVKQPKFYVIPQAYDQIIYRLKANKIKLIQISKDTNIKVTAYRIHSFQTTNSAYEGHYLHYDIDTYPEYLEQKFYKGDYLISTNQKNIRFLTETLEPRAHDSYFAWNFFDNVLQQKEWFSDYAFEPKADSILRENALLKAQFDLKKQKDSSFSKSSFQQLYFIYKASQYFEKTVNLYPIFRIEK